MSHPKRPRDPNQLAKSIIDIATGEKPDNDPDVGKDAAAVSLGRKGGLKGGAGISELQTGISVRGPAVCHRQGPLG
jgi:hypothetical protein